MTIRTRTDSPLYGLPSFDRTGVFATTGETRSINLLIRPDTTIVYLPSAPPTVGQAWPRGDMCR